MQATTNGYQLALQALLVSMLKAGGFTVDFVATATNSDTEEIAAFSQMVEKRIGAIIFQPGSSSAFVPAVQRAAAAGIPTISVINSVNSPDTINVGGNDWYMGALMAQHIAQELGGRGKVLDVHGIAGVGVDITTFQGVAAVFAHCPGITAGNTIYDDFLESSAKSDVQTYLETHPQQVNAVITSGPGSTGVMEGFQSAGKTVPTIGNDAMDEGELAYWYQHKARYDGVGVTMTPPQIASAAVTIVRDLYAGDGVKVSDIVLQTPLITDATVSRWYTSSMTTSSTGTASGPASLSALPGSELDYLLTNPPAR